MAPIRNTRVLFNSVPQGYPVPGETTVVDHSQTLDLDAVDLAGGKVLAKTLSISIDPYLRGKMRSPEKKTYNQPFEIGKPLYSHAVVKVLRSENPKYKAGDYVYGVFDWAEYQVFSEGLDARVLPPDSGIPWSVYVGVAGMPGKTAYYGWKEIAKAKKGETIYVSTAAGPVGSVVVQLAKAEGLKVIASAGQESKLQFLRDLGADVVFNYKTTSVEKVLEEHGPVDIFWDHVGGSTTNTVLAHMNTFGRVVVIGSISSYNTPQAEPIANFPHILYKRLTVRGLIVTDHEKEYRDAFYATIPGQIARGEIKYTETIVRSLDEAPQLLLDVQKGDNTGKAVVILADD
ncbi:alcohol dehydrogenase [Auricularia subglabra TFB-10046 SS5]|uniref:Alcohol dehydrogenase n=1 Tax=Auricularia subglabra (strain TFB-10046 / SS5) TaxID=717982 RepID=J0CZR3_AURST|nr:alcohol dehydrogenase [Auricularia subglabra TFB-10046 SS5]